MVQACPVVFAAVFVISFGHLAAESVSPTTTISLSYISLDYDLNGVPGRTTVTCRAPRSVTLCFLRLSRMVNYGPKARTSVILAEVDNAEKWTNPDVAKLPNTTVSGIGNERLITYTMTKVSCLDAGTYTCTICVDNDGTYSYATDPKVLKVTVNPGHIGTSGNMEHEVTSRNPAVDLSCTAPVGTVGPDEKVVWVWEFKAAGRSAWRRVKNCERIEIDVTTNRMERYCIAVQTTVLKLRPEAGDSSGQYRCYVERDNIAFTEFAPVYTVKLRLSSQTSSATSQTPLPLSCFRSDPATTPAAADETSTDAKAAVANSTVSSNSGAKDSATERYILWILTGILGFAILCTILLVCFTVWRKLAKKKASEGSRGGKAQEPQGGSQWPAAQPPADWDRYWSAVIQQQPLSRVENKKDVAGGFDLSSSPPPHRHWDRTGDDSSVLRNFGADVGPLGSTSRTERPRRGRWRKHRTRHKRRPRSSTDPRNVTMEGSGVDSSELSETKSDDSGSGVGSDSGSAHSEDSSDRSKERSADEAEDENEGSSEERIKDSRSRDPSDLFGQAAI